MRSVRSLYSIAHKLVSIVFSAWLPRALNIILLTLIVVSTAGERLTADYKYNAKIKKTTSKFVYSRHHNKIVKYCNFSLRWSSLPPPPPLECAICITEFVDGEVGTTLESCGHKFHASCVGKWLLLEGNNRRASCPLCRSPVVCESGGVAEEHREEKTDGGGLISEAFEEELGLLLLPGLRYVNSCAGLCNFIEF